jgi:cysteinyl-tRNA synthetase
MATRVFNTLTRGKEDLAPLHAGEIRMYVCGVTVYDLSHIGHGRSGIVFDVMRRYLKHRGHAVRFVKNFTDIDDKIIRKANQEGVSAQEISERYIEAYRTDMASLGVAPADIEPKATEHVPQMIALIERLIVKGVAYPVEGDVYFEVRRFPGYGKLSGKNLEELQAGARVEVDERKRDPMDFALWKATKPGEPSWKSPWGQGRPGWHIECSAMAMQYLGEVLDVHGGGEDLIFPHHENEIAQSEAATGKPFSRYWLHNGFVNLSAEKMSKSLGNTLTIKDLVRRHDPEALRLYLLGTHYRHPLEFGDERIVEASRAWRRGPPRPSAPAAGAEGRGGPRRHARDAGAGSRPRALRRGRGAARPLRGGDGRRLQHAAGPGRPLRSGPRAARSARAGGRGDGGRGRVPPGRGRAGDAGAGARPARGRTQGSGRRSAAQGPNRIARLPPPGGAAAARLRGSRPAPG